MYEVQILRSGWSVRHGVPTSNAEAEAKAETEAEVGAEAEADFTVRTFSSRGRGASLLQRWDSESPKFEVCMAFGVMVWLHNYGSAWTFGLRPSKSNEFEQMFTLKVRNGTVPNSRKEALTTECEG